MRENKASKAEKTLGDRKIGENNYNNGNWCETVFLNARKPAENYQHQVRVKQNNAIMWSHFPPSSFKAKSSEMTDLKSHRMGTPGRFDQDWAKMTTFLNPKCGNTLLVWKR